MILLCSSLTCLANALSVCGNLCMQKCHHVLDLGAAQQRTTELGYSGMELSTLLEHTLNVLTNKTATIRHKSDEDICISSSHHVTTKRFIDVSCMTSITDDVTTRPIRHVGNECNR